LNVDGAYVLIQVVDFTRSRNGNNPGVSAPKARREKSARESRSSSSQTALEIRQLVYWLQLDLLRLAETYPRLKSVLPRELLDLIENG
jgi:hypothetical protein